MPALAVVLAMLAALARPCPASAQIEPTPPFEPRRWSTPPPGLDTPELRLDWLEARSAELSSWGLREEALALIERHATPDLLADGAWFRRLVHMTERIEPPAIEPTLLYVGAPLLGAGALCGIVCTTAAAFATSSGLGGEYDATVVAPIGIASAAVAAIGLVLMVAHLIDVLRPERLEFSGRRGDLVRRLHYLHRDARARRR